MMSHEIIKKVFSIKMMCGGWGNTQVTDSHREVVTLITADLNTKLNAHHTYTVVEVKQQVVAGICLLFSPFP
jgi:hypothetical protein